MNEYNNLSGYGFVKKGNNSTTHSIKLFLLKTVLSLAALFFSKRFASIFSPPDATIPRGVLNTPRVVGTTNLKILLYLLIFPTADNSYSNYTTNTQCGK